jgi:ankyrin repeat protein
MNHKEQKPTGAAVRNAARSKASIVALLILLALFAYGWWLWYVDEVGALRRGDVDAVAAALDRGIDLRGRYSENEETLLHLATWRGQRDVAALLLERGAEIEARDKFGRTPLFMAAQFGQRNVAQLLIERGADVNAADRSGRTPLQAAVNAGHGDVADLLRQKGAADGKPADAS